jgi:hypothetical protein
MQSWGTSVMARVPKNSKTPEPDPIRPRAENRCDCAMFEFHGAARGKPRNPGIYPSVPEDRQREFEAAFYAQIGIVKKWFTDAGWIAENTELLSLQKSATYQPDKIFHVFVSEEYNFSRALVPAWSAQRGRMEFPANRVVAGEAAVAHELVHVFFPNANRMLAEGLAVYLHQCVGPNPAFPNFKVDLHQLVAQLLDKGAGPFNDAGDLSKISIGSLDKIPTPDDMTFRIGQQNCDDASVTYVLAGSFTQFLIEKCEPAPEREAGRCPTFSKLYAQTPLVPMVRNPGSPGRWKQIYQRSLEDLEAEWKKLIRAHLPPKHAS